MPRRGSVSQVELDSGLFTQGDKWLVQCPVYTAVPASCFPDHMPSPLHWGPLKGPLGLLFSFPLTLLNPGIIELPSPLTERTGEAAFQKNCGPS